MRAVVAAGIIVAAALSPPFGLVRLVARIRSDITFYVPTSDPLVALTLDDGPHPDVTPQVLDVLRRHDARATFFLIGSRAERWPGVVRRIVKEGHELGNHLWLDEQAARMSDVEFERSLLRTHQVLVRKGAVHLLRPGSGWVTGTKVRLAERYGYRCVLGSVYPYDAQLRSGRWISWRVRLGVRPGAIVILHEGHPSRCRLPSVLEEVLVDLRRRGYGVVSASELLAHSAASG